MSRIRLQLTTPPGLNRIFSVRLQIAIPSDLVREAFWLGRAFHDRHPLLRAVCIRLQQEAVITFLNNLDTNWLLDHWSKTTLANDRFLILSRQSIRRQSGLDAGESRRSARQAG